jgi:hypothetical protein
MIYITVVLDMHGQKVDTSWQTSFGGFAKSFKDKSFKEMGVFNAIVALPSGIEPLSPP